MKKYYAVIDTNVLVSAMLKWHSVPGNIIELAFSNVIIPVFNMEILEEYKNVLSRPKFHLNTKLVNDIIDEFIKRGISVDPTGTDADLPDPKDVVFYEVVMEERKQEPAYLVTGNVKHFPVNTFIVTPRQMLDIILMPDNSETQCDSSS